MMSKHSLPRRLICAVILAAVIAGAASCSGGGESGGIILGAKDFLFQKTSENYDYLADFRGEIPFSDDEMIKIERALTKRSIAYANSNVIYIPVAIPNAQSVYPEYMPSSAGIQKNSTQESS